MRCTIAGTGFGLGLTLLALHQMLDVTIPYQDAPALRFFRLDLIRELKRLNAHLVAGAVRPILEL